MILFRSFRFKHVLSLALLLKMFSFSMQAGVEQRIISLSGIAPNMPLASGSNLKVQDQWYGVSGAPSFVNKSGNVNVILRYADTRHTVASAAWTLEVDYTITTYGFTGGGTNFGTTTTPEKLIINYDPAKGVKYTDKAMKQYPGSYMAVFHVTGIKLPSGPVTGNLPAGYEDVYLDLEQVTERYYSNTLPTPSAPVVNLAYGFNTTSPDKNELPLTWTYCPGAESYDVEWLFIDQATSGSPALPVDMADATRINTTNNHYEIPLTYGRGLIIYRVRGVGVNTDISTLDVRLESPWSFDVPAGTLSSSSLILSTASYLYAGDNLNFNWSYSVAYAEDGKRMEGMQFMDGLGNGRQSVGENHTDDKAVISESIYDYEGRAAVSILPTPFTNSGLHYYTNDPSNPAISADFNGGFDKSMFDRSNPATVTNVESPQAMATTDRANQFYSQANPYLASANGYLPDAEGYPYVRSRFKADGTNRIRSQSAAGANHKLGSGRETKYFYGTPTGQNEIDRMFGNEAGPLAHYKKNMVIDANGQASISYLDQEGRVIATALSGTGATNLMNIDGQPADSTFAENMLKANSWKQDGSLQSMATFLVSATAPYAFTYSLGAASCVHDPAHCDSICATCAYDVEIQLLDENGAYVSTSKITGVSSNPVLFTNVPSVASTSCSFTATLDPGSYTVNKILRLSQTNLDAVRSTYLADQSLSHLCVKAPAISAANCVFNCDTACINSYQRATTSGTVYFDDAGKPTTAAIALALINTCKANMCGLGTTGIDPSTDDECTRNKNSMLADMSPGGQYFDNTPFVKIADNNSSSPTYGSYIPNPAYEIDGWLYANSQSTAMLAAVNGWITIPSHSPYTEWAQVRANWIPVFADLLLVYHPEYCRYVAYCSDQVCSDGDEVISGSGTLTMADVWRFQNTMLKINDDSTASLAGDFNPLNVPNDATHGSSFTYCPSVYTYVPANADPYFKCEHLDTCVSGGMTLTTDRIDIMRNLLLQYIVVPGLGTYSIWYVIDDPDHLANPTTVPTPGTPAYDLYKFFVSIHGSTTTSPATVGLIGAGPGQISKYQFFRSAYLYYRNLIMYKNIPRSCIDASANDTLKHYSYYYPGNPIYDQYNLCNLSSAITNITNYVNTSLQSTCASNCASYADGWMTELSTCTSGLSSAQKALMRQSLIDVCTANCDDPTKTTNNPQSGTNGCSTCPAVVYPSTGTTLGTFHTFDDVVNYFTGTTSCAAHVVHPKPAYNPIACSWSNMQDFMAQYSLSGLNLTNSTDCATLAAKLNSIKNPNPVYTASDVSSWYTVYTGGSSLCTDYSNSSTYAPFPPSMRCSCDEGDAINYDAATCSCQNLHAFINTYSLDPDKIAGTSASGAAAVEAQITSMFNDVSGGTYTSSTIHSWILECAKTVPTLTNLSAIAYPALLTCPDPATVSPAGNVFEASKEAACLQSSLQQSMNSSSLAYATNLKQHADDYMKVFKRACTNALGGSETFSLSYPSLEYQYTLYFYDQAGNLIKTVPPKGFTPLGATDITAAQAYRATGTGAFIGTSHTLTTIYKYNSLQQLIYQNTPDGGTSLFYYDVLGRLVASQNAKQAGLSGSGSFVYSYTLYDALGRISEVGQLTAPTTLSDALARDQVSGQTFLAWVATGTKTQITSTYYDEYLGSSLGLTTVPGYFNLSTSSTIRSPQHLRNRVASSTYKEVNNTLNVYDNATHYSYDDHGNVQVMIQEVTALMAGGNGLKRIDYTYDLVSGNMNLVHYSDQNGNSVNRRNFYHRYFYDTDNRLREVNTSLDSVFWDKDGKYAYYLTGALNRTEVGDKQVQGMDYTYTINGWMKGVNSGYLASNRDMGKDAAYLGSTALNANFGTDAFGYTLGYFMTNSGVSSPHTSDYQSLNNSVTASTDKFEINHSGSDAYKAGLTDLFNGNISTMVTSMQNLAGGLLSTQGRAFRYDRLNRLKFSNTFESPDAASNTWTSTTSPGMNYAEIFSYDFNGNLDKVGRYNAGVQKDTLMYNYTASSNKLAYVTDGVTATDDIVSQSSGNYSYDAIGNLTADLQEETATIEWNVYGKVKKITRVARSSRSDMEFVYDATGKRIAKIVKPKNPGTGGSYPTASNQNQWVYTYYVYDAQGNVMSTYTKTYAPNTPQAAGYTEYQEVYNLNEFDIYGSSRLGLYEAAASNQTYAFSSGGSFNSDGTFNSTTYPTPGTPTVPSGPQLYARELGDKLYEGSNHLGNVLVTFTDKKLMTGGAVAYTSNFTTTDSWTATSGSSTITALNPNLQIVTGTLYNGAVRSVSTVIGNTYSLELDLGVGAGQSIGVAVYDASYATVLATTGTSSSEHVTLNFKATTTTTNLKVYTNIAGAPMTFTVAGVRMYQALVYIADVQSYSDYYAFGAPMPGRNANTGAYRYGFNGMEKDDEVHNGAGLSYTTEFRQYDPRFGRWMSKDPVTQPWESPYVSMGNNPILFIDPLGDFKTKFGAWLYSKTHKNAGTPYKSGNSWVVNDAILDKNGKQIGFYTENTGDLGKAINLISRVANNVWNGVKSSVTAINHQLKVWGKDDEKFLQGQSVFNPWGSTVERSNGGGIENQAPDGKSTNSGSSSGVLAKYADNETDKTGYFPGSLVGAENENPYVNAKWSKIIGATKGHTIEPFGKGGEVVGKISETYEEMKKEQEAAKENNPELKEQTDIGVTHWLDLSVQNANGIETIQVPDNAFNRGLVDKANKGGVVKKGDVKGVPR
jgi:RHS repeat-associated protein